jgi:FAD-linked oxidoreductase
MYKKLPFWQNWARNVQCSPSDILHPETEQAIVNIIKDAAAANKRIRVAGNGHSFTELDSTKETMVLLDKLQGLIALDANTSKASAWAGTSINNMNRMLFEKGYNLVNLGDIDVQSIAGATATGTHGTGLRFGNVSSQMSSFNIATANGEVIECSKDKNPDIFKAGQVSLGSLGIITQMTMDVVPAYKLEYVAKKANLFKTLDQLDEYIANNRNYEFYWFPYTYTVQNKFSNETHKPVKDSAVMKYINQHVMENGFFGMLCGIGSSVPGSYLPLAKIIGAGATSERKINHSHLVYATPRNVRFKEMEYNIPIEHFKEAMQRIVRKIHDEQYRVYFPVECRFVKGDDIWLSPSYGRDSAYLAFHVDNRTPHNPYFKDIENILMEYGGRPHWGKMHSRTADTLATAYPMWDKFHEIRKKLDPNAMFMNDYVKEMFGA